MYRSKITYKNPGFIKTTCCDRRKLENDTQNDFSSRWLSMAKITSAPLTIMTMTAYKTAYKTAPTKSPMAMLSASRQSSLHL